MKNSFTNLSNQELIELGKNTRETYLSMDPFPYIFFDDFFNKEMLDKVLNEFPDLSLNKKSHKYNDPLQSKLASDSEDGFGETTLRFMHFLNSAPFLDFLSVLTGIDYLIPDPYYVGGGHHQILPGGFLKIHADFNKHPHTKLDRRLNVLVYLNKDWDESYGGEFELWDKDMIDCKAKILPIFNRMALFTTTDFSYHGHPNPLNCPIDRKRQSIALYYYTNGRPSSEINPGLEEHSTLFKLRNGIDDKVALRMKLKQTIELITPPIISKAYNFLKR